MLKNALLIIINRNIMEVAQDDTMIKKSKWKLLHHINQCRLYVKAFTIEELTKDGINIHLPYLNGTERGVREDSIVIPDVRRPTDNQWRLWKSFIFRNFLSPGTQINPPLGEKIYERDEQLLLPVSETDLMLNTSMEGLSLGDMVNLLPNNLRVMMGIVTTPADDGLTISEAIVEGTCLGASDGSLVKEFRSQKGAHGYALEKKGQQSNGIEGYGISPDSDRMSSLTTEHYGLIGLLVTLHIVCIKYKLCREECFDHVVILIDNKTVVKRGNKRQEIINLSDYSVPDQDLWQLTTELIEKLPIAIKLCWIRGHQDSNQYGEKIFGPFSQEVQMNMQVDDLANRGMHMERRNPIPRPNLHNAVMTVYDKNGVAILDMRSYMTEKINGGRMLEYLMRKRNWDDDILSSIEWEGIGGMMKQANPIKRIQILKLLHGWQNIGSQKGKIRDARLRLDTDRPLEPTIDEVNCHLCPSGCGEKEDELHFLHCPEGSEVTKREELIRTALKKLKALCTYDGIVSLVRLILTKVSRREKMDDDFVDTKFDGPLSMAELVENQDRIGWMAFCQGYYHVGWARAQQAHYRREGIKKKSLNIGRWKKKFSVILGDFCLDCWKQRNETLHGKEMDEAKRKVLQKLRLKTKQLYKLKHELRGSKNSGIFDMPLYKRIRFGIQSMTIWVGMAEEVLKLHRENATKNTILHWLGP